MGLVVEFQYPFQEVYCKNPSFQSDIFSKLKKRLYNTNSKKTPKKNGDCSDKKRKLSSSNNEDSKDYAKKRSKLTTTNLAGKSEHVVSTSFQQNCNDPHISDDFSNDSSTDESSDDTKVGVYPLIEKKTAGDTNEKEPVDDDNIIERHINALKKEISKKSANLSNIEFYLDKTFDYRRKQLKGLNIDKRIELLDTEYPCFKDCVQIMNELKRILGISKTTDLKNILSEEIETIIYYGICVKGIKPPNSFKKELKMIYFMKNICSIFPRGDKKKGHAIIYELEEHEEPEKTIARINARSHPVLIYDNELCYIIFKKTILCSVERSDIVEAVLAYFGVYYMLDLDYPHNCEVAFGVIQNLVFKDQGAPKEIVNVISEHLQRYNNYKSE